MTRKLYKLENPNKNIVTHTIETQMHIHPYFKFKIRPFLFCHTRYELAQQLQPQSTEDPLGGGTVAHDMQVEIEGDSLPQPPATSAEQQSMLGLGQTEVVNGSQQVTLEAPLTDQPLVQGEGTQGRGPWYIMDGLLSRPTRYRPRAPGSEPLYEVTGLFLLESQSNV